MFIVIFSEVEIYSEFNNSNQILLVDGVSAKKKKTSDVTGN